MELGQLKTLCMVGETANFTRAARRLGLTQSAVSHQIKMLEDELGEPLFIRVKRGVLVSEAGKVALEYATRILEDSEALRERDPLRSASPHPRPHRVVCDGQEVS